MEMPATKRHRPTPHSSHLHRSSSSPSLPSSSDPCHCSNSSHSTRTFSRESSSHDAQGHSATQPSSADVALKLSSPSSRPAHHPLQAASNHEPEPAWGFLSPSPPAFSSSSQANHTTLHHDHHDHAPHIRESSPDPDPSCTHARIFLSSHGRSYGTIAEAVEHATVGDEIVLSAGVYVETQPIVLQADGVILRAEGDSDDE
eukprot:CAMPEP_0181300142 /NCGR_PEP_ID=MMETSP1101-20121128/6728_1 /TAXON_ID=46948 /ORGANISM="Rhodomonas abbreviata, Strain Caron Lab Isolate" /LENGTH=200 /DNA_ID=CAMNT_0023405351 /DNA_START=374 /DNA_END=973 /DNA_ORIENTATION=-